MSKKLVNLSSARESKVLSSIFCIQYKISLFLKNEKSNLMIKNPQKKKRLLLRIIFFHDSFYNSLKRSKFERSVTKTLFCHEQNNVP